MHVPKCYYLQHFEARMCQNAFIYGTSEPHDADILLFARHSIRLFVVPSQYLAGAPPPGPSLGPPARVMLVPGRARLAPVRLPRYVRSHRPGRRNMRSQTINWLGTGKRRMVGVTALPENIRNPFRKIPKPHPDYQKNLDFLRVLCPP